jgi:hypothetical protein
MCEAVSSGGTGFKCYRAETGEVGPTLRVPLVRTQLAWQSAQSADFSAAGRALRAPLQSDSRVEVTLPLTPVKRVYPAKLRGGFKDWSKAAEHLCVATCRRPDDALESDLKRWERILSRNRADRACTGSRRSSDSRRERNGQRQR